MNNDYVIVNGELYHAGVKGMRWGVRRWQNEDGTLTEAGKKRYGVRTKIVSTQKPNRLPGGIIDESNPKPNRLPGTIVKNSRAEYETRGRSSAKAVLAGIGGATVGTAVSLGAVYAGALWLAKDFLENLDI